MANGKGRRSVLRRRTRRTKIGSKVNQVSTGLPISKRTGSRDPPLLPTHLTFSTICRFIVRSEFSSTLEGFKVILPSLPHALGQIVIYYRKVGLHDPKNGTLSRTISLNIDEIIAYATRRIFAQDISVTGNIVKDTTMFAINKVALYGTTNSVISDRIGLTVSFGPTIPGWVGYDSGNKNQRAFCKCTPPRLVWNNFTALSDPADTITVAYDTISSFQTATDIMAVQDLGVLDISMTARRSALIVQNTASHKMKTEFGE